jgi:CheY-like chemotaxis protein
VTSFVATWICAPTISIDDFGTGYSSLSYLNQLSVDELKIDRSFILDLEIDSRTERIVRSIIDLGHSLGLKVVAEGVEDGSVADRLVVLGIDYLQGYALARPATGPATTDWLRAKSVEVAAKKARLRSKPTLSVLVVDGSPADRTALRERLRANKHRVIQAQTCEAALQACARRMPDVVILDHMRPHLNGIEIAPRLRAAGYAGPILLFKGSQSDDVSAGRFPLDVWPVSAQDEALLVELIDGYATNRTVRPAENNCKPTSRDPPRVRR